MKKIMLTCAILLNFSAAFAQRYEVIFDANSPQVLGLLKQTQVQDCIRSLENKKEAKLILNRVSLRGDDQMPYKKTVQFEGQLQKDEKNLSDAKFEITEDSTYSENPFGAGTYQCLIN